MSVLNLSELQCVLCAPYQSPSQHLLYKVNASGQNSTEVQIIMWVVSVVQVGFKKLKDNGIDLCFRINSYPCTNELVVKLLATD